MALIEINLTWLGQAARLLTTLTDAAFAQSPPGLEPHKAGSHLRHVLDFYESFLAGIDTGYIDYDLRRRDPRLERDRLFAINKITSIAERLRLLQNREETIWVRMEDADFWLASSVSRELQTLSSHTIHHFALIAVTLQAHGVTLDPDFGMAPSTLRHHQRTVAA